MQVSVFNNEFQDKFWFLRTFKDIKFFQEFKDKWEACGLVWKTERNTTKAHIHQSKECTTTQNKQNLKPGSVASYDIRPGNGEGLFWFWRFINLSLPYLLRHLPTYL